MQDELPRIHMLVAISPWGTKPFLPSIPSIPSFLSFEKMHYIVSCFNNWIVYTTPKSTTRGRFQLSVKLMKKRIKIFPVCVFFLEQWREDANYVAGIERLISMLVYRCWSTYLLLTKTNLFVAVFCNEEEDFVPRCYHIQGQTPSMLSSLWKSPIELHGTLYGCGLRWATWC